MNQQRLLELAVRRGELTAHIAMQRSALAANMRPVARWLGTADRVVDGGRWLKRHPQALVAFLAALAIARPRRAWRWAKRAVFLWRGWKTLRYHLSA